ncbi:hypothetical protein [Ramlibacter albus]|uniref:Uncharacterized protein n=1 Tax=Ramlibacter albus TaxID=2079448 RepID=A0A923M9P7_9BURK|nr:hypothetical protein [Ramlibacter albus]MBC5765940.1 hypothetical protein [Ramlibacter albus]
MSSDKPGLGDDDLAYWRERFHSQPREERRHFVWEDYSPAYRYGAEAYEANPKGKFEDAESRLESGWDKARRLSRLEWSDARIAAFDAWQRARDLANRDPD